MTPAEPIDASSFRFAIVASRFNHRVTERLVEGALACFEKHGAREVAVEWVPGSFELPLACREVATLPPGGRDLPKLLSGEGTGRRPVLHAVVALGCVIRGETLHFELVAAAAARGIMDTMLETGVPIAFGVLTTDTVEQAEARAGGARGNEGWDAAETAIEMAATLRRLSGR